MWRNYRSSHARPAIEALVYTHGRPWTQHRQFPLPVESLTKLGKNQPNCQNNKTRKRRTLIAISKRKKRHFSLARNRKWRRPIWDFLLWWKDLYWEMGLLPSLEAGNVREKMRITTALQTHKKVNFQPLEAKLLFFYFTYVQTNRPFRKLFVYVPSWSQAQNSCLERERKLSRT